MKMKTLMMSAMSLFRFLAVWTLLLAEPAVVRADGHSPGENNSTNRQLVCFNGYVMDHFCIARGTLLDAPSRKTLEYPNIHSVHCLVDVNSCRNSDFEMLSDPQPGSKLHGRVFRLDDTGRQAVVDLARTVGDCGTCQRAGTLVDGLRVTVVGYMDPTDTVSSPALLNVTEVRSNDFPCLESEGGQFVPTNVNFEQGFGAAGVDPVNLHGGLMIAAWGVLVPTAVLSSLFFRHRLGGTWFVIHRICNGLALFITFIGIVYAFIKFGNIFSSGAKPSQRHATLGMTTFVCGFTQALMGIFRPHLPETPKPTTTTRTIVEQPAETTSSTLEDEMVIAHSSSHDNTSEKSTLRKTFEMVHRGLGYSTVALAYTTMYFGAQVSGSRQDAFFGVWYALFGIAAGIAGWMLWDKWQHRRAAKRSSSSTAKAVEDAEKEPMA